ncbi:MAG: methanesulfonate monooxygenase [Candidatus Rokuibacteriota bacterium]|nr:MAG: methanesulfonate monooxygenase [Candidatus Rokubacteria bacterium]
MVAVGEQSSDTIARSVHTLIYRGCLLLDQNDFKSWLDLCSPEFHYTVSTYSPEIRREQVWLDHDHEGMSNLIRMLPRHNSDQTPLTRHATVYTVEHDAGSQEARAVTSVAIFATALDGGETTLFALARYHDVVDVSASPPRLKRRTVRLQTRSLGIGKHWPL